MNVTSVKWEHYRLLKLDFSLWYFIRF